MTDVFDVEELAQLAGTTDHRGRGVLLQKDLDLIASVRGERLNVRRAVALDLLRGATAELVQASVLVYQGGDRSELLLPTQGVRRALLVTEAIGGPQL